MKETTLDINLLLDSPNDELPPLNSIFWGTNQLYFLPKWCDVGATSNWLFLELDSHLKVMSLKPTKLFQFVEPSLMDPHLKCP
jgi:hypothetical protein